MRVEWSEQARSDFLDIFQHVASDNPHAARALLEKLRGATTQLGEHPYSGRVVPEFEVANIRERVLPPYRLIYQVQLQVILVLTVIHSRRALRSIGSSSFER